VVEKEDLGGAGKPRSGIIRKRGSAEKATVAQIDNHAALSKATFWACLKSWAQSCFRLRVLVEIS